MPNRSSSNQTCIRILIANQDATAYQELDGRPIGQGKIEIVGRAESAQEILQKVADLQPALAIIDGDYPQLQPFQTTQKICLEDCSTGVIFVSGNRDPAALRRAIQAGVLEYLMKPVQSEVMAEIVEDAFYQRAQLKISRPVVDIVAPLTQKTVCLVSGRSGVGRSTIAVNVGFVLQQELGKRVAIVDFQFGEVALMMNLKPTQGIAELIPTDGEVDFKRLRSYVTTHTSGVDVYVGSPQPRFLQSPVYDQGSVSRILGSLRQNYDHVIADLPIPLAPQANSLSEAGQILVITMAWDLITLRETHALLQALRNQGCGQEQLKLVINRSVSEGVISEGNLLRILDVPVWARIPNDGLAVVQSLNAGVPIVLSQPHDPVSQSLRILARKIADMPEELQPARKKLSLFQ